MKQIVFIQYKMAIGSLLGSLTGHLREIMLKEHMMKHRKDIHNLYKKHESAFQKMGLVKYDAFHQMGGQLSFSLALLDENNNGFIINSILLLTGGGGVLYCFSHLKYWSF